LRFHCDPDEITPDPAFPALMENSVGWRISRTNRQPHIYPDVRGVRPVLMPTKIALRSSD